MLIHRHIGLKNEVFCTLARRNGFKLRLMLTGTLIFFELNRRYSVLSGLTDSLFPIIHEKISVMQVSINVKAEEANIKIIIAEYILSLYKRQQFGAVYYYNQVYAHLSWVFRALHSQ